MYKMTKIFLLSVVILFNSINVNSGEANLNENQNLIKINSHELLIDSNSNQITFTGNVIAQHDKFTIDCQKMIIFYDKADIERDINENIAKIVASENVKITIHKKYIARAGKAEYLRDQQIILLTDHPFIEWDKNSIKGCEITFLISDEKIKAKSCDINDQVKATIYQ